MNDPERSADTEARTLDPSQSWTTADPVPERPHMPEQVVAWLESQLRRTQCFLEYGSGGSTRLAASIGVPRIISVESDRDFADSVEEMVANSGTTSVFNLLFADIGPTQAWGFPKSYRAFRHWPNYALNAWDYLRGQKLAPDLILIDGRFRLGCFFVSLLESRPGTVIAFDDFADRNEYYGVGEQFLKPTQIIDRCAVFTVPNALPRRAITRALARTICSPE